MNLLIGAINPHAIEWGPVVIHWYGVIIAVGIFLAVYLSTNEAKRKRLDEDLIADLTLWLIPVGFLGARLYYVLFE